MKAITVRQPWAWLIFHGKDIENRDWYTRYRGELWIHAAKGMTRREYDYAKEFVAAFDPELAARIPPPDELVRSAIIGRVIVRRGVTLSRSPWFVGPFGLELAEQKLCDPIPAKGALGLWEYQEAS